MPNSSFNDESWLYNNNNNNNNSNNNYSELKSSYNNETLQEPVPFEDFKFSFGINTDFSSTITTEEFSSSTILDPFLQEPFTFMPEPNTVLDENDQKAFSSFLDAFFMDPEMQFNQQQNNGFYSFNNQQQQEEEKEEENRRSSILQSLDEQKMLHQRLSLITSPTTADHQCNSNSNSSIISSNSNSNSNSNRLRSPSINNTSSVTSTSEDDLPQSIYLRQSDSISSHYTNNSTSGSSIIRNNRKRNLVPREKLTTNKKARTNKELLTEEEKRANHIASEQKRRSTIRNGFKDLTDLIPNLKNINNSKSTVLFKAVDFIKYLEKRTKGLRDKVGSLELRVEVEGRMTTTTNSNNSSKQQVKDSIMISDEDEPVVAMAKEAKNPIKKPITMATTTTTTNNNNKNKNNKNISTTTTLMNNINNNNNNYKNTYMNQTSHLQGLPANARNALLAHKTQQKQLLILQEQLQLHQRLIAQQQEMKERSMISVKNKLPPILGQYDTSSTTSFLLKELEDKSISAP
ncbi:hypothetical protein BD770DRAFT_348914 [Pilaira anomala]|nr:hypothetical protein BD770DRAFT_348914 [Pilaira anomala]